MSPFAVGAALVPAPTPPLLATVLAAPLASAGVPVERRLFFAEARHGVML